MPADNRFKHQTYSSAPPKGRYALIKPTVGPAVGSAEFHDRMLQVGEKLRTAQVGEIHLVHGTFVGDDLFAVGDILGRYLPNAARSSKRMTKRLVDWLLGEVTNFSPDYVETMQSALRSGSKGLPVRRFVWSSVNNHIGRAVGAVQLLDVLMRRAKPGERLLVCGHSHAGNVMALLTNLMAADRAELQRFFDACSVYFRRPDPVWQRVYRELMHGPPPHEKLSVDFVTFGTPVRYGWDSRAYRRLLHFVNHHPTPGRPPYRSGLPGTFTRALSGADGDYVQQYGIAGSNFTTPLDWRGWQADRRLAKLIAEGQLARHFLRRVGMGMRVPEEGLTLLVDYGREPSRWIPHFFGHGVYTQQRWMLFHAEQIAHWLYETPQTNVISTQQSEISEIVTAPQAS